MHSPSFLGDSAARGRVLGTVALLAFSLHAWAAQPAWKPAVGPLMTKWAKDVKPGNVLPEYPRPQMVREEWQNLNGLWDYAIADKDAPAPTQWAGKILVPFPVQSALSGVMTNVNENQRLWYSRKFAIPRGWQTRRIVLNFGAVDWDTTVWVNGKEVGKHQGGYDGFSFDITDSLHAKSENELMVSVWDPSDAGPQPRGKQVRKPGGIWYTPSSGIWQTVWLEPIAANSNNPYIKSLKIVPDVDRSRVRITVGLSGPMQSASQVDAVVTQRGKRVADGGRHGGTEEFEIYIPKPQLWSPENPTLYELTVSYRGKLNTVFDTVTSYFAMRKISMARDSQGRLRMQLNNTNYFQLGPLDQGFWPDGLYTAPTDQALRWDIEMTKKLGFNMARKHVKVEPERWYYWCDKLGLLVWQDMPSGDKSAHWRGPSGYDGEEMKRTPESTAIYEKELRALIEGRANHPCIVIWVPFNEGWGQFDTVRILNLTKQLDPTRLVDGASGGNHFPAGDILDHHQYPGPGAPAAVTDRAMVLGEFGGLGLPLKGHTWQSEKNWGYRSFTNAEALTKNYVNLIRKLQPMIEDKGLSAAIYTQTTDVEVEINGLMTYDRAVVKMPVETVAKANRFQFPPEPVQRVLSPTATQHIGVTWRYTTEKPGDDWFKTDFDANAWTEGRAGFGTAGTPGAIIGTEWKTPDIWLRREFDVKEVPRELRVLMAHDEDAEVYFNGVLAAHVKGHIGEYQEFEVAADAAKSLRPGRNVLAVHCHQTTGGQYIDVGIMELVPPSAAAASAADAKAAGARSQGAAAFVGQVASGTGSTPPRTAAVTTPVPQLKRDGLYVQNRAPLVPAPFMKLPIGAITPKGWLRHQLDLEARGLTGRLPEISPWLNYEKSSWSSAGGEGNFGWEEMPYWLKGYGDLAYVLKDERLLAETRKWIEAILRTQREDGYFGPRSLLTSLKGQPDLWPHMLVLNILQSWQEYSGDERVIPFLMKYHRWLNGRPAAQFGVGYWPTIRFGDNIETCHWLYNRTGEPFLLELARRIHENMAPWRNDVINWHNVNIAQGFRAPGIFFTQSGDRHDLERADLNYRRVMDEFGQFPGGGFGGDENCRKGYTDPRQGFETCGMVEFMHSFEMLTRISGNPLWSDRCEEIAFNSFPAALTPDWKGLHYLTCANQVQLDKNNHAPAVENGGTMFSYSPFEVYRCCQHNVSHGWPYFAEELWLATADRGLCASLYAASEVKAKVADGTPVTIREETDYPFNDFITLKIATARPVKFPLHLRIPGWCQRPLVSVNGKSVPLQSGPLSYAVLDREWKNGDVATLRLPMTLNVRRWEKNHGAASIDYGPLTFSLKIGEKWTRYGKNPQWPEWEVFPTTPWNYGLELDARNPAKSLQIVRKTGPLPANPFTHETNPLELRAKARKIPEWRLDRLPIVGKLQASPVKSTEPVETVSLIPMGAARLRISAIPVLGRGDDARAWVPVKASPVTVSHCFGNDTVEAMFDGLEPKNSSDGSIPRFTWWDHRGTAEWVEWGFPRVRAISAMEIYWFDDAPRGGCRAPQSWKLFYRVGERWLPVEGASEFGTKINTYNRTTFPPIQAEGLRLEVKLQPDFSAGILEWKAQE